MRRIRKERETNGWSRWIQPRMDNYIMVCCDCGLAHRLQFKTFKIVRRYANGMIAMEPVKRHAVRFRAQRAPAYTRRARS